MSTAELLARAQAQGLLPPQARWPDAPQRPWPVQAFTAVGAWVVAVPLLAFIAILIGPLVREGVGLALVGLALVTVGVMLLRDRAMPLFVEQLAVPVLLVGLLCVGWRLHESLPPTPAWWLMAALCLGLARPLPHAWLRILLGAGAAGCVWASSHPWWGSGQALGLAHWSAGVAMVAAWALWSKLPLPARWAQALESASSGWLLAVLFALAAHSGSTWLVAGLTGLHSGGTHWGASALAVGSLAAAALGAVLLVQAWPALRRPRWLALLALLALPALLLPGLGPIALAAALCARQKRWRLATASGLAALWVLGAFYYQLGWPLADKALALLALGLALGVLVAPGLRRPSTAIGAVSPWRWGVLLALGLTVAVVNVGIGQKERLIANGERLFVPLAPADPRSLMQGDFMRLNFGALSPATDATRPATWGADRPRAVLRRDAQGIATWLRTDDGSPLAADERRVELSPKDGRWILVTDAWFFREGEAARWERARFGEFRVTPDGRALLVGLRGEGLAPL